MTSERWQEVKAIFDGAVECDPAARAEFLRKCCGTDEELRREVESLLAAEGGSTRYPHRRRSESLSQWRRRPTRLC